MSILYRCIFSKVLNKIMNTSPSSQEEEADTDLTPYSRAKRPRYRIPSNITKVTKY